MDHQATIKSSFRVDGVNVYTGKKNYATFHPAMHNSGIYFHHGGQAIRASLQNATTSAWGIALRRPGLEIRLVEHLLSPAYALGIDNLAVELSDGVCPTTDNAVEEYFREMKERVQFQDAPKKLWAFNASDRFSSATERSPNGKADSLTVVPCKGFYVSYFADYSNKGILPQSFRMEVTPNQYQQNIMRARPLAKDLPTKMLNKLLLKAGKRGMHGITGQNYLFPYEGLNPKGFEARYGGEEHELVRHKALDVLGTLALTEMHFRETEFRFNKTGHKFDLWAIRELLRKGAFVEYLGPHNGRKELRQTDGQIRE